MASEDAVSTLALKKSNSNATGMDKLPQEINEMKIKDDKVLFYLSQFFDLLSSQGVLFKKLPFFSVLQEMEATVVDGNGTETGHIIVTTIGGKNGQPKEVHVIFG